MARDEPPSENRPDIPPHLDGASESTIEVLRRAAATAPSTTALELLDAALALMEVDDVGRGDVLAAKARVLVSLGQTSASAEAAALVAPASSLATCLRHHVTAVLARLAQGHSADPVPTIEEWCARLGLDGRELHAGDEPAIIEYALVEMITGHPMAAAATIEALWEDEVSRAAIEEDEVLSVLVGTARAVTGLYRGTIDDAVAEATAVQATVERTGRIAELAGYVPLVGCGVVLARAGHPDAGLRALASARQMLHSFGLVWMESICDANVAMVLFDAGLWDDALAVVDGGIAGGDDHGQVAYVPWLLAIRALVLARRGDLAGAEAACAQAGTGHPAAFNGHDHLCWARATVAEARGDSERRDRALDDLVDVLLATGVEALPGSMGLDVVRAHLAAGRSTRADEVSSHLPDATEHPVVAALAAAGRALVAGRADHLADAAATLAPALPYDAARLWEDAAVAAAAKGQAVGDNANRAAQGYRALGAATDLARLGARVPQAVIAAAPVAAVGAGLDALTHTERRVTRLVVEGRSNVEIADQLCVSRRTVESHLARVFTKVGVRTRLQLAVLTQDDP